MKKWFCLILVALLWGCGTESISEEETGLGIYQDHPQYWAYHGEPVLLLGGSDEDNLFQLPELEKQLDLLISAGGNYVRNTMSSRDTGNVWPFLQDAGSGLYDMGKWNDIYWDRFRQLLDLTHNREIIVQIEIWATFDFYRENWLLNPFNPDNNINYTPERSKLPVSVDTHPTMCDNPFFWSVPSQHNNMPLLAYQQRFVDKLLSYSLQYDNVLYCIDNETSVTADWGRFWSDYIRKRAAEEGKKIDVTEMWDPHDLNHISHRETFDHPEFYSYVEISQNNHQRGENQWKNGLKQIERLVASGNLRPVNNVKTYGNWNGRHGGGTHNGIESFVRSALFGSAAVRFHRPTSGLGLGDTARAVIHSLRMATDQIDIFNADPHNDLLMDREQNEAYCRAIPGNEYLVYFTNPGEVKLDLQQFRGEVRINRLDMLNESWDDEKIVEVGDSPELISSSKHVIFILKCIK